MITAETTTAQVRSALRRALPKNERPGLVLRAMDRLERASLLDAAAGPCGAACSRCRSPAPPATRCTASGSATPCTRSWCRSRSAPGSPPPSWTWCRGRRCPRGC
ncbi:hypothetical protein OIM90_29480 [Streptomyces sp. AD16]|nr:hypothetical protein OIM90_29480 [Streptomyces sp. AD16]